MKLNEKGNETDNEKQIMKPIETISNLLSKLQRRAMTGSHPRPQTAAARSASSVAPGGDGDGARPS